MAKIPVQVDKSITVNVPQEKVYAFLADVVSSAQCIPGIDKCVRAGDDTYRFVYKERSTGPIKVVMQYTSHYEMDGKGRIRYKSIGAQGDSADIDGEIQVEKSGADAARIVLKQTLAPETPVPRLLQALARSFVEKEAAAGVDEYLANVKRALEGGGK